MLPLLLRRDTGVRATPASLRVLMKPSRLLMASSSSPGPARLEAAAVGVPPPLPLLPCSL
jgi:hypothetical protein